MRFFAFALLGAVAIACGGDSRLVPTVAPAKPAAGEQAAPTGPSTWKAPASQQRPGDPARGRRALLSENYIGCGVPESVIPSNMFPATPLDGRDDAQRGLPFYLTRYDTSDGVTVVTANCLGCHAAYLDGELVMGLGTTSIDFTVNPTGPLSMLARLTRGPARREIEKLRSRVDALYPSIALETAGPNPADHIAAVLFAHRDPKTLAWSDEPLMKPPDHIPAPVDVPPWWRMAKKNAMFYTAGGRGDHARIMMTASALCTDSVEQATAIDRHFPDIRAYIASIEPPEFPRERHPISSEKASAGAKHFAARCARCHGTYDPDPAKETYPNLVVSLETVGTDPQLAIGGGQFAKRFVDWFNRSFYGSISRLEPQRGYSAPPLDGVWATAPFFHNGSVPTLAAVLDSSSRPARWRRTSISSSSYDFVSAGWSFVSLTSDELAELDDARWVYDTSRYGHSAAGHTFADSLSASERAELLEYLKTL